VRYEAVLRPQAVRVLDSLTDPDRREVLRLVEHIRLDPSPNGTTRIVLMVPPAVFTVLVQSGFWIVYHVSGSQVSIVNVGRDETQPRHR
jgi:hypothetical protein